MTPALDQIIHEPTDLLSAAYYRRQASRARELAGTATTPAIKNRLGEVALECDRLADLVDVTASNILADEGRTVIQQHLSWRRVAQRRGRGNGTAATAVHRF